MGERGVLRGGTVLCSFTAWAHFVHGELQPFQLHKPNPIKVGFWPVNIERGPVNEILLVVGGGGQQRGWRRRTECDFHTGSFFFFFVCFLKRAFVLMQQRIHATCTQQDTPLTAQRQMLKHTHRHTQTGGGEWRQLWCVVGFSLGLSEVGW